MDGKVTFNLKRILTFLLADFIFYLLFHILTLVDDYNAIGFIFFVMIIGIAREAFLFFFLGTFTFVQQILLRVNEKFAFTISFMLTFGLSLLFFADYKFGKSIFLLSQILDLSEIRVNLLPMVLAYIIAMVGLYLLKRKKNLKLT